VYNIQSENSSASLKKILPEYDIDYQLSTLKAAFEMTKANDTAVLVELGQNRLVVAALIISLTVLVAGIIGFGKKKDQ